MTTNPEQHNTIITDVLAKIRNREVTLKPRAYFKLRLAALIVVLIALFVVSIFFASFLVFTFRAGGQHSLLEFGRSGLAVLFLLFPWQWFILEIVLIVVVEWLLRSFSFGYKLPGLYLLGAVLVVMVLTGIVVDQTSFHDRLLERADTDDLPGFLEEFYEHVRIPPPEGHDVFRGTVINIDGLVLMVALDNPAGRGTTTPVRVVIPEGGTTTVHVGDRVFILGHREDGEIQLREIRSAGDIPPPHEEEGELEVY